MRPTTQSHGQGGKGMGCEVSAALHHHLVHRAQNLKHIDGSESQVSIQWWRTFKEAMGCLKRRTTASSLRRKVEVEDKDPPDPDHRRCYPLF
jgi:hypothetical protein